MARKFGNFPRRLATTTTTASIHDVEKFICHKVRVVHSRKWWNSEKKMKNNLQQHHQRKKSRAYSAEWRTDECNKWWWKGSYEIKYHFPFRDFKAKVYHFNWLKSPERERERKADGKNGDEVRLLEKFNWQNVNAQRNGWGRRWRGKNETSRKCYVRRTCLTKSCLMDRIFHLYLSEIGLKKCGTTRAFATIEKKIICVRKVGTVLVVLTATNQAYWLQRRSAIRNVVHIHYT